MNARPPLATLALVAGVCFLPAGELPCASAGSMDGLMRAWTEGFTAWHPETPARIARRAAFSAAFVELLARGEIRVAAFACEWFPAERERFTALTGDAPVLVPVATGSHATKGGTHAIVVFVHRNNPLAGLPLDRLREIFAEDGRIRRWGQLGLDGEWADRPITVHGMPVRRDSGHPPGIVNFLDDRLLAGRAWRNDLVQHADEPDGTQGLERIVRAVAADEAAIGYSGLAYAVPGVKPLWLAEAREGPFVECTPANVAQRRYPLTRTIYLAIGPRPDRTTLGFLLHVLSTEGQRAIAQDDGGFHPLTEAVLAAARSLVAARDDAMPPYKPRLVSPPQDESFVTTEGAVAVVGYNDMAEMLAALAAGFSRWHPGIRFDFRLTGTRAAPDALAEGRSAFAPMGAEFSPGQLARYRAVTGADPVMFRVARCSLDPRALSGPLAIIVHPANPLASLGLDEVAEIFTGHNMRGLHPFGLATETALGIFMRERVLGGQAFGASFRGFGQSREVVEAVEADPLAIGFTAAMRVTPGVKVLALAANPAMPPVALTEATLRAGRYPLERFLLIYVRHPIEPITRGFLDFVLSRDGQAVIAGGTLGYLPLNADELAAERAKLERLLVRQPKK